MRTKKLAKNTISSLIFQLTAIICGFVLPRLILGFYGSEINGLVQTITQFLSLIAFLELGVGAVVQSSLYKPLADNDKETISAIWKSANKFFQILASILLVYVIILIFALPAVVNTGCSFSFTATLIAAMCISTFAQYYFGIVNRLLLTADQRGYIQYNAQTITLLLNTFACAIVIRAGLSIQVMKLTTSMLYLLRPLYLHFYVKKYYDIDKNISYIGEPIKQKWNGIAQHIASVVLDSTDTIVLSVFSSLTNVSIYSVYFLVINGVKTLFLSMTNGIQSLMGEMWARQDIDELKKFFQVVEWVIHTGTTVLFGCTMLLIVPFVNVYTKGINDVNYIVPNFAILIVLANALHCLRLPYNLMILAGGHYKQTQSNYIIAALMNIIISIVMVKNQGIIGVAIGTIIAMTYQTVWMAFYNTKNFINWPMKKFIKQCFVDIVTLLTVCLIAKNFISLSETYVSWSILSIEVVFVMVIVSAMVNFIFYRSLLSKITNIFFNKIKT